MRTHRFVLIGAVLVTLWAYAPLRRAGFVYDDQRSLAMQPITGAQLGAALVAMAKVRPRTLTVFSFWVTKYLAADLHPRVYHLTSLVLHLSVGLLLYWAAIPVFGALGASVAAAVFLVHPLNTQAVSYISARSELVGAVGVCLALGSAVRNSWLGLIGGTVIAILGKETDL